MTKNIIIFIFAAVFLVNSSFAQLIEKQIDDLIANEYKQDEPGGTILIAKDDKVIYRKGFGMANMEHNIAMKPEMVFEIGSISKQFTAVAILMLVESGQLTLQDEITKFIPDYPTNGKKITVHHLLTHTSGIKSYTEMEKWAKVWRNDLTPLEMIDIFKNEPMDFAPGEKFYYSNSGYFLLGYLIEKASGMPYEKFVEEKIFKPLQMNNSYYGEQARIIPNRASGYQKQVEFFNAEYLSLTQPYAAGSIMSTVDDLLKWNQAIVSNKLIKQESRNLAWTSAKLNDGGETGYGYGWAIDDVNGLKSIEHSGGIFGYSTNGIWIPEAKVYVIMLTNRDDQGPTNVSTKVAAIAAGKPYPNISNAIAYEEKELKKLIGIYQFEDGAKRSITYENGFLYSQRDANARFKLIPIAINKFSYEDAFSAIEFMPQKKNKINAVFSNRANKSNGYRTDEKIVVVEEFKIDPKTLDKFVGEYEVQLGFSFVVTKEDNKLMIQATGQPKFELFAKTESRFFLKVVPAEMEFRSTKDGAVDAMTLYQGGQEILAMKK